MNNNPPPHKKPRTIYDVLKPRDNQTKRSATPSTPTPPPRSSFVACPLCNVAIHYKLIETHAATCNGESAEPPGTAPTTTPSAHPLPATHGASTPSAPSSQQHVDTQPSSQGQPSSQAHSSSQQPSSQQPSQQQPSSQGRPSSKEQPSSQQQQSSSSQGQHDALRVLMVNQQARGTVYHFHLHYQENTQGWTWAWMTRAQWLGEQGAAVRGSVAWQGSMQLAAAIHTAADKHTTPKKPTLQLTTNLPPAAGGPVTHNVSNMASSRPTPLGQCHIGTALGKSALQKNIRLGRAGEAVRCSVQLVKDDVDAFIRRASIICLEDTILHPALPLLVWLTCATSKGYELGATAASACLAIVAQMARVSVHDLLPPTPPPPVLLTMVDRDVMQGQVSPQEAMLVRCLLIRSAFGGMPGDVKMLKEYAALWYARFTGTLPPPPTNPQQSPPPPLQSPPPPQPSGGDGLQKQTKNDGWFDRLCGVYQHVPTTVYGVYAVQAVQLLDIPLSAVDFHVCRIVDELAESPAVRSAAAACVDDVEDTTQVVSLLKTCMWKYRSSINRRGVWDGGVPVPTKHQGQGSKGVVHAVSLSQEPHSAVGSTQGGTQGSVEVRVRGDDDDNGEYEDAALGTFWKAVHPLVEQWAGKYLRKLFF